MKQLIEEQKQKDTAKILDILIWQKAITDEGINYRGEKDWALNKILDWHKQSLKQFIDGLIEEANVRVATLEELKAKFNLEIDKHRIDEVERYISYLKKLKEQLN